VGGEECSCSIGVCVCEKVITIGVEFWGVREGIGVLPFVCLELSFTKMHK